MTECQYCNSTLVTNGLSPGQQIRCANCLSLLTFGKIEKVETHRLAWRSFWLGLSSILLLFFTGLPAIYYGIRSLLRMRFVKPKSSDRAAAIAGTALGGCFGIFVGFLAVCGLIIGLISYLTYQETDDVVEVVQKCSEYFEFEVPKSLMPVKATSILNNHATFEFADSKKATERNVRIQLRRDGASIQTNRDRVVQSLMRTRVNKQKMGKPEPSEILKWEMDGEVVDVRKTIYLRPRETDSNEPSSAPPVEAADKEPTAVEMLETHQYFAYLLRDDGYYGLVVVFEPDGFELSESDVRAIFANTKIVDKTNTPSTPDAK